MNRILRIRKDRPGVGRRLARELDLDEITCGHRPKARLGSHEVIINYGRSQRPVWDSGDLVVLNHWASVANTVDKTRAFNKMKAFGIPTVDWTIDSDVARAMVADGHRVYQRMTTKGKQGKGIIITDNVRDIRDDCPLFTMEFPKTHEFRVHVMRRPGTATYEVIDYVQKKKMGKKKRAERGLTCVDSDIRSHKRGWVFAHNDVMHVPDVETIALAAVRALELDFAGVDVLYDDNSCQAVVCEVNSAPGMSSPTTFGKYCEGFSKHFAYHNGR